MSIINVIFLTNVEKCAISPKTSLLMLYKTTGLFEASIQTRQLWKQWHRDITTDAPSEPKPDSITHSTASFVEQESKRYQYSIYSGSGPQVLLFWQLHISEWQLWKGRESTYRKSVSKIKVWRIITLICRQNWDKVKNEEVRKRTGQILLEKVLRERRMRWLGHVARMN